MNESQPIEIYGNYQMKGNENNSGCMVPKDKSKSTGGPGLVGNPGLSGNMRGPWSLKSWWFHKQVEKNNEKGSEKSLTYFTYSTILLFKCLLQGSTLGISWGEFQNSRQYVGAITNYYNVILASPTNLPTLRQCLLPFSKDL